ncbi:Box C/D snoRNA accumulation [Maublancomyces gigas]|uniref:Box C/D snoRNA accumulation n=1 Tax=Discina gigas TaxID=1032678 RepID=A0ABR3GX31_9PEZI
MSTAFDLESQSTTSIALTDTTLLSDLCPFCNESPPKYRCPACDSRTCSLKCSNRHKAYKQCSGTRDPTAYVRRSKLTTPTALNRDFNFLAGVERAVTRGSEISTDDGEGSDLTRNAEQKKRQAAQAREMWIEKSGVIVKRAPQGMKRSRENRTDVVKVMETSRLTNAFFHPNNSESRKKSKAEMTKTRFYLKKVGTPANRPTLIPLNPTAELKDCIRGRTVDEYPTIYITTESEHPKGFDIEQSIAAGARGKLEVLEETSRGHIVNMDKLEAAIGPYAGGSKRVVPTVSGAEMETPGKQEDNSSIEDQTALKSENLQSPVGGSAVANGRMKEDGGAQDGLVASALLELIGANGISMEVVGDLGAFKAEAEAPGTVSGETDV